MKKKNILLITADQWSGNYLGCAGNTEISTPSLDELARYGIRYENAISSTPVCIPARRELMCGVESRKHGDRNFNESLPMPEDIPTMAEALRMQGYQTVCVGKLHVFPQRDRIGFDDVILHEEGRHLAGMKMDDYERYLYHNGHPGEEFGHGMCNNNYFGMSFHLEDKFHPTNWVTREMCEQILRRDPTKPCFWYASYAAPHPPLTPPAEYLHMYDDVEFAYPEAGEWTKEEDCPYAVKYYSGLYPNKSKKAIDNAKRAYYGSCSYIDNQIRLILGTLREQKILEDTVILFTADHGDMLGTNGLFGKFLMFENSVKIPMILLPTADSGIRCGQVDDRIVELRDVMPTLMELAGAKVPESVDGMSMVGETKREYTYGELWLDDRATRMIRTNEYKLIWYITGNHFQFFDLKNDSAETVNLIDRPEHKERIAEMKKLLMEHIYGEDVAYVKDNDFVGLPHKEYDYLKSIADSSKLFKGRDLLLQRGLR